MIASSGNKMERDMAGSGISLSNLYRKQLVRSEAKHQSPPYLINADTLSYLLSQEESSDLDGSKIDIINKALCSGYYMFLYSSDFEKGHALLHSLQSLSSQVTLSSRIKRQLEFEIRRTRGLGLCEEGKHALAVKELSAAISNCPKVNGYFAAGLVDSLLLLTETYQAIYCHEDAMNSARLAIDTAHERLTLLRKNSSSFSSDVSGPLLSPLTGTVLSYCLLAHELQVSSLIDISTNWYQRAHQICTKFIVDEDVAAFVSAKFVPVTVKILPEGEKEEKGEKETSDERSVEWFIPAQNRLDDGHVRESSIEHNNNTVRLTSGPNSPTEGAGEAYDYSSNAGNFFFPGLPISPTAQRSKSFSISSMSPSSRNSRQKDKNVPVKTHRESNPRKQEERMKPASIASPSSRSIIMIPLFSDEESSLPRGTKDKSSTKPKKSAKPSLKTVEKPAEDNSILTEDVKKNLFHSTDKHDTRASKASERRPKTQNNAAITPTSKASVSVIDKNSVTDDAKERPNTSHMQSNKGDLSKLLSMQSFSLQSHSVRDRNIARIKSSTSLLALHEHIDDGTDSMSSSLYIPYFKGLQVEAKYQVRRLGDAARWCPGRITRADFTNGLFDVEFEHGDTEHNIFVDNIRIPGYGSKLSLVRSLVARNKASKSDPQLSDDVRVSEVLSMDRSDSTARDLRRCSTEEMHKVMKDILSGVSGRLEVYNTDKAALKNVLATRIQALLRGVRIRSHFSSVRNSILREREFLLIRKELCDRVKELFDWHEYNSYSICIENAQEVEAVDQSSVGIQTSTSLIISSNTQDTANVEPILESSLSESPARKVARDIDVQVDSAPLLFTATTTIKPVDKLTDRQSVELIQSLMASLQEQQARLLQYQAYSQLDVSSQLVGLDSLLRDQQLDMEELRRSEQIKRFEVMGDMRSILKKIEIYRIEKLRRQASHPSDQSSMLLDTASFHTQHIEEVAQDPPKSAIIVAKYKVGDRIVCDYYGKGVYYVGTIYKARHNSHHNYYDVHYDDGELECRIKEPRIYPLDTQHTVQAKVITSPKVHQHIFHVEDRVLAKYHNSKWYAGKIRKKRHKNRYDVIFDDGEIVQALECRHIRIYTLDDTHLSSHDHKPQRLLFVMGSKIEANRYGQGNWIEGEIVRVREREGLYDIQYTKDHTIERRIAPNMIRPLSTFSQQRPQDAYQEGCTVLVNYRGSGQWYEGKIIRVRPNSLYDLQLGDGRVEYRVDRERIQLQQANKGGKSTSDDKELKLLVPTYPHHEDVLANNLEDGVLPDASLDLSGSHATYDTILDKSDSNELSLDSELRSSVDYSL